MIWSRFYPPRRFVFILHFVVLSDFSSPQRTWKSRIRACVIGRDSIYGGSDIVIIARTDSLAVEGYDSALDRVREMGQYHRILLLMNVLAPCGTRLRR